MSVLINNESIKKILSPENLNNIKKSQESAKQISDQLKNSITVDSNIIKEPYTV